MLKEQAIEKAITIASDNCVEMVVINNKLSETPAEPFEYCPKDAVNVLFRFYDMVASFDHNGNRN